MFSRSCLGPDHKFNLGPPTLNPKPLKKGSMISFCQSPPGGFPKLGLPFWGYKGFIIGVHIGVP